MFRSRLSLMTCAFMLFTTLAWAQSADVQLDVKKHTLANGLRILVLENHSAPVFSSITRFSTGSVDEYPGITGSSHLLEHMLGLLQNGDFYGKWYAVGLSSYQVGRFSGFGGFYDADSRLFEPHLPPRGAIGQTTPFRPRSGE